MTLSAPPRLEGGGVRVRPFTDRDVELIYEVSADPSITSLTAVPPAADAEAALEFIRQQHARQTEGRGYSFAIASSDTDRACGQIGLWLDRYERASLGYWVAARRRGGGVASAALALVSHWCLTLPAVHRLELHIQPWNEGSRRTAERVGYRREGLLRSWQEVGGARRDMLMYSLLRDDLASRNAPTGQPARGGGSSLRGGGVSRQPGACA
ncbi:GNAT family protein [Cryptosporangium japonicum]|uniref:GNAT family N-acetyltransferase n=1 Tax=Cryptosporangium japonicum TaxID=80872 RepID=UPI0031CEAACC